MKTNIILFDNCPTKDVPSRKSKIFLTDLIMQKQTTSIREFLRNYKKFSTANKVIIIANHGKPEGVFVPYEKWEQQQKHKSQTFTWEDVEQYSFGGGSPNMSTDIDKILYGSGNKTCKKKK